MTTLTITAKGQITLRKEVLRALGVGPRDKVDVQMMPDGKVILQRTRRAGMIEDFLGVVQDKVSRSLSDQELDEVIAAGWAGRR